jgi:hypothetical protein
MNEPETIIAPPLPVDHLANDPAPADPPAAKPVAADPPPATAKETHPILKWLNSPWSE